MKLKVLIEEFVKMVKYIPPVGYSKLEPLQMEIYKNPTPKEFKGLGVRSVDNIRCVLTYDGDLYTVNNQDDIIHNDILRLMGKEKVEWGTNSKYLDNFICLYRNPKNAYRLSTMYSGVVKKKFFKDYKEHYNKVNNRVNIKE